METAEMGRVVVSAKLENLNDHLEARAGRLSSDQVRFVEVSDAIVDTGAKLLALPKRLIQQLGLERFETRMALTSAGLKPCDLYHAVWLTVQGRRCSVDVSEVPDECPVLIGYIPLELLDFVVSPGERKLIGDPRHNGQNMIELY